jgi:fucose 4-O-acetylase-like acetyltransferase
MLRVITGTIAGVLVRVIIAVMKHHYQNKKWGRKSFLVLYFHITVHHPRKLAQALKQGRIL